MRLGPIFKEIIQTIEKQVMAEKIPMTKYEINMVVTGILYAHAFFSKATVQGDRTTQNQFTKEVAQWIDRELPAFHALFCNKCKEDDKDGHG